MSSVLDKNDADKVAVSYTPRKFPVVISPVAKEFVSHQAESGKSRFRIDPLNAAQTGVAELERMSIEQQVEQLALEKMKSVQEEAYREAYQLGLDEGRDRAFAEHKADLEEKLASFDRVLTALSTLKNDLVTANEAHLMKLLMHMASRIAMDEVRSRPELILSVLRQAVESARSEEEVVARVSKQDLEFIEKAKERLGREMEFTKRVKLEESEGVSPGGCIVETNYGSVDASIEKRVARLWEIMAEKMPKVSDTVGES